CKPNNKQRTRMIKGGVVPYREATPNARAIPRRALSNGGHKFGEGRNFAKSMHKEIKNPQKSIAHLEQKCYTTLRKRKKYGSMEELALSHACAGVYPPTLRISPRRTGNSIPFL